MRRSRGFVFSLDAFVAFSLILIAIQTMVLISASPAGYWKALLQAQFLAKDTLNDISTTMTSNGVSALGEASGRIADRATLDSSFRIIQISDKIIQKPYSYAYSYYDINTDQWSVVYNASHDEGPDGPHANISFKRVEASAQKLMLEYVDLPVRPQSPYCNVYCKGWLGTTQNNTGADSCIQTPCNTTPMSAYQYGNLTFGLLRLTVWG
ncbi:Uncharacterised protein [uncultured archaeon]|nr:Uncharacterised protein [uncultured archaeon]